jgi:hypothetical protein
MYNNNQENKDEDIENVRDINTIMNSIEKKAHQICCFYIMQKLR